MSDERNKAESTENEVLHDNITDDIDATDKKELPAKEPKEINLFGEAADSDGLGPTGSDEPTLFDTEDGSEHKALADTEGGEDAASSTSEGGTSLPNSDCDTSLPDSEGDGVKEADGEAEEADGAIDDTDVGDLDEFDDEVKEPEKSRKVDSLFDFIEIFVFTLAAVFIITSFFIRYSIVDGPSMQNSLQHGDKLLLTNFMYEPEYKDIVVVHSDVLDKVIVKRVIATEGQKIKITSTDVYVDGVKLDEPYVYTDDHKGILGNYSEYKYLPEGEVFEMTVPEGEIFVMGDHRNKSEDSRSIGTISEEAIIGKVILRFAPFDTFGRVD